MASKQTYECFQCKKNGFPDVRVYLDGKTEDGKTIYKNEDMTPHQHKQQTKQPAQQAKQQQPQAEPFPKISDESVQRGITAFTMMSDLIGAVEENKQQLVAINEKLDRLINLTAAAAATTATTRK